MEEQFDLEKWKRLKAKQATCLHSEIKVTKGRTTNDRPITRFACIDCMQKFSSLQMDVNDEDRIIASKKHQGKTLKEIAEIDMPYLFWVAVKSKMGQVDRYACARMCMKVPYVVPLDGEIIDQSRLYDKAPSLSIQFIRDNGGII